jgi:DNA modification methylase
MYVEHTIEFLRAIRRVLKKDGVVFWNIGDSYIAGCTVGRADKSNYGGKRGVHCLRADSSKGLKQKDLALIPSRVAIAAQEDGWYIRSIIIWNKNCAMPESVKDRPTESHEYILMLTKSPRYFWDIDAVREPHKESTLRRIERGTHENPKGQWRVRPRDCQRLGERFAPSGGHNIRSVWTFSTQTFAIEMCQACGRIYDTSEYEQLPEITSKLYNERRRDAENTIQVNRGRPLNPPNHPFRGEGWEQQAIEGRGQEIRHKICYCGASDWLSHFATFPEELPRRCILAATSERGNCSHCRKPWVRAKSGWQPSCNCNALPEPCVVLDPFCGAGTTLKVAKSLGRKAIGIDISEEYCKLAIRRVMEVPLPMFYREG